MNESFQGYQTANSRDRRRPAPDDPEAAFYGAGGEPGRWVDADGGPEARSRYRPAYGYSRYGRVAPRRHSGWVKWLVIALVILFAIPLLKAALLLVVVASAALALLIGLVVFLALLAVGGALLFGAGRVLVGGRHHRM